MHYSPPAGKLLGHTPNPSSTAWSAKFNCVVVGWDLGTSYQWLASASNTGVGAFSTTSEANTVAVSGGIQQPDAVGTTVNLGA